MEKNLQGLTAEQTQKMLASLENNPLLQQKLEKAKENYSKIEKQVERLLTSFKS